MRGVWQWPLQTSTLPPTRFGQRYWHSVDRHVFLIYPLWLIVLTNWEIIWETVRCRIGKWDKPVGLIYSYSCTIHFYCFGWGRYWVGWAGVVLQELKKFTATCSSPVFPLFVYTVTSIFQHPETRVGGRRGPITAPPGRVIGLYTIYDPMEAHFFRRMGFTCL